MKNAHDPKEIPAASLLEKAEKDPYKFIEKYKESSDITLYKPNLRETFLDKITQSCTEVYTLRI